MTRTPLSSDQSKPSSIAEMRAAIMGVLRRLDPESGSPWRYPLTLRRERGHLVLRADLKKLVHWRVRVELSDEAIRFRRSNKEESIPLDLIRARARVHPRQLWIEFSRREQAEGPPMEPHAIADVSPETREALERINVALRERPNSVFLTRALNALARLSQLVPRQTLAAATTASTDYRVLVRALQDPAVVEELASVDPLGPARIRGLEARQRLVESGGGTLTASQAAGILNISRQAVDKRRRAGKLIGLTLGRRGYAYPAWQFSERGTIAGLESILGALRAHDPWMQTAFMLNGNTRLGERTPLEELRSGKIQAVRQAAESYAEHGAR